MDEIIHGVNIVLGTAPVSGCPRFDPDGNGQVDITDLIRAVSVALSTCPVEATATASATPPTTATPSATETALAEPSTTPTQTHTGTPGPTDTPSQTVSEAAFVGGTTAVLSNAMMAINAAISSVIVTVRGGAPPTLMQRAVDLVNCPIAGTTSQTCTQELNQVDLSLSAVECAAHGPAGSTIRFSGMVRLQGFGSCPLPPAGGTYSADLSIEITTAGGHTSTITAQIGGTLAANVDLFSACLVDTLTGSLSGLVRATMEDGTGAAIDFDDTQFVFSEPTFNADCVPVRYAFSLDGAANVAETLSGKSFAVIFRNLTAIQDARLSPITIQLNGGVSSPCLATPMVLINTPEPLSLIDGEFCPRDGELSVVATATSRVAYRSDGSVDIDSNGDGSTDVSYPTCLASQLLSCEGID